MPNIAWTLSRVKWEGRSILGRKANPDHSHFEGKAHNGIFPSLFILRRWRWRSYQVGSIGNSFGMKSNGQGGVAVWFPSAFRCNASQSVAYALASNS